MSAQRRAATKQKSGSNRAKGQRNRASSAATAVQEPPAAIEQPFDTELDARKPVKKGPSRASQLSQAGKQIVSLERTEGIRRFWRETMAEMKKIIWPDRETTRNLTLVVIAVSAVLGVLLGGIDFILFRLFEALS